MVVDISNRSEEKAQTKLLHCRVYLSDIATKPREYNKSSNPVVSVHFVVRVWSIIHKCGSRRFWRQAMGWHWWQYIQRMHRFHGQIVCKLFEFARGKGICCHLKKYQKCFFEQQNCRSEFKNFMTFVII